jgi:hypothetical protein
MVNYLKTGVVNPRFKAYGRTDKFKALAKDFRLEADTLIYTPEEREVLREEDREPVIKKLYDDKSQSIGIGIEQLYTKLNDEYIGITLEDVKDFVQGQMRYQLTKPYVRPHNRSQIWHSPNQCYYIDHVELQEYSDRNGGVKYSFHVYDGFSGYLWVFPQDTTHSRNVIRDLRVVEQETEVRPQMIVSDNASVFKGKEFQEYCDEVPAIKHIFTTTYNPRGNKVEGVNKLFRKALREIFIETNDTNWVDYVDDIAEAWNTTTHQKKLTPTFLHYGVDTGDEDAEQLREEIIEAEKEKARKRVAKNDATDLEIGDVVRLSTYQTDKDVRKAYKKGEFKKITVRWTTDKYIIYKRYRSRQGTQKTSYCLITEEGEPLINENGNPRRFYSTDLQKVGEIDKLPPIKKKEIPPEELKPPAKAKRLNKVIEEEKKEELPELRRSTRERKTASKYSGEEWTK